MITLEKLVRSSLYQTKAQYAVNVLSPKQSILRGYVMASSKSILQLVTCTVGKVTGVQLGDCLETVGKGVERPLLSSSESTVNNSVNH